MKIKITSDSTCDLSPELLRENDIELFPLSVSYTHLTLPTILLV